MSPPALPLAVFELFVYLWVEIWCLSLVAVRRSDQRNRVPARLVLERPLSLTTVAE